MSPSPTANNMPDTFDVLIVGAGPAGSSLAIRLARSGYRVGLIDKKRFPRPKPCGEFLSPECLPMLADLDVLDRVLIRGGRGIRGMRIHGYGHRALGGFRSIGSSRVPHALGGYAIRREILDEELLAAAGQAGAAVLEGFTCRSLIRNDGRVAGVVAATSRGEPLDLRARWIIGADGVRSVVARELGVQRRIPWLDKFALTTHFGKVPALTTAELHVFPGGYFAAAPVGADTLSLNLVIDRDRLRQRCSSWDEFLGQYLTRVPELAERLSGSIRISPVRGVGPLAWRTTAQTFDGAALVGDACGYIDPMTGEGIYFALRTAQLLADDLERAMSREPAAAPGHALRRYARARRREIGSRAMLSKLLQVGLHHEPVARLVLRALERHRGLAELLVSFSGDYVRFRDALRPSVWWRALTLRGSVNRRIRLGMPPRARSGTSPARR